MKVKELVDYIGLFTYANVFYEGDMKCTEKHLLQSELREKYGDKEIFEIHAVNDWEIGIELKK